MSEFQYNDILNYKYPNPEIEEDFPNKILRSAQFAPFEALTGHDEAIKETARHTDKKIELDEYEKDELNRKLNYVIEHIDDEHIFSITYFVPDEIKDGGWYETITDTVIKVKECENTVVMSDKTEISISDIMMIKGDIFSVTEIE